MSTLFKHIPLEELSDLAENRTAARERERLTMHVSSCNECSEKLRHLEQVFAFMRTDTAPDAPRDVVARAIGLFQPEVGQSLVRRVLAVLSFDSVNLAPAFGTRSGSHESRQLLYSAEDNDIDLHISAQDNGWRVTGQVLGEGCQNGEIEIEGEGISHSVRLSDSCEFNLPVIPSGDYRLCLRLTDIEVEVPRIELGI